MGRMRVRVLLTTAILVLSNVALADYATTVKTPKGTSVQAIVFTVDFSSTEKTAINNKYKSLYPNATYISTATKKYNCHSYAWYNQSTANAYWINDPNDNTFWTDGSYKWICNADGGQSIPSQVPDGAKVSYGLADHSAVKYSTTKYRSKWGQGPLMQHAPGYDPYGCVNCCFPVVYYKKP